MQKNGWPVLACCCRKAVVREPDESVGRRIWSQRVLLRTLGALGQGGRDALGHIGVIATEVRAVGVFPAEAVADLKLVKPEIRVRLAPISVARRELHRAEAGAAIAIRAQETRQKGGGLAQGPPQTTIARDIGR